jgi:hypothetical protein
MDSNTFNNIVKDQLEKSEATLIKKAAEYASEGDRLHNFKLAALLQEISEKEALSGMMTKHTISVYDIIKSDGPTPSQAYIDEKIGDLINYLLLLKAVLHELRPEDDPERTLFREEPLAEWEKELISPTARAGWYSLSGSRVIPKGCQAIMEAVTHNQAEQLVELGYRPRTQDAIQEKLEADLEIKIVAGWYKKDGLETLTSTTGETIHAVLQGYKYDRPYAADLQAFVPDWYINTDTNVYMFVLNPTVAAEIQKDGFRPMTEKEKINRNIGIKY